MRNFLPEKQNRPRYKTKVKQSARRETAGNQEGRLSSRSLCWRGVPPGVAAFLGRVDRYNHWFIRAGQFLCMSSLEGLCLGQKRLFRARNGRGNKSIPKPKGETIIQDLTIKAGETHTRTQEKYFIILKSTLAALKAGTFPSHEKSGSYIEQNIPASRSAT